MTASFIDFLKADQQWENYSALCSEHREAAQHWKARAEDYMREYLKWKCCKGALEWFNMDLDSSGDMSFTGLNHELCGEWLVDGEEVFERKMALALVTAGKAAEKYIKDMTHYECSKTNKEQREEHLREVYNKQKEEG